MSLPEKVHLRKENSVAWITINRPEVLNACDLETLKKLQDAFKAAGSDEGVRCVVLTGAGRAFCAGADLRALKERGSSDRFSFKQDLVGGFNPVVSRIRNMDKAVIAMVNGVAAGAGMGLAFACDLRIVSEKARFVEAFAKVGLVPDTGATYFMPRLLGLTKAMELAFTGEGFDAKEAERLGIVNKLVQADQLESETRSLAERLAKGPKGAGLAKRALNRAMFMDLEQALEYEALLQDVAGNTFDHGEGLAAFNERREPQFQGK